LTYFNRLYLTIGPDGCRKLRQRIANFWPSIPRMLRLTITSALR
jgi:hypothetical protein